MVSALRVTWCRWEPGKRLALRTVYAAGWGLGGGFPPHSPGESVYNNLEGLGHAWDRLADSLRKPAPPSPPPFLTTARRRAPVGELHPAFLALVATVLALRILPEKSSEKMPGMEVDGILGLEPPFLGAQGSGRLGEGLMEPAHAARTPLANLPAASAPCARLPSECPRLAPAPAL